MRSFLALAALFVCGLSTFAQGAGTGRIGERIFAIKQKGVRFQPVELFSLQAPTSGTDSLWRDACEKADVLRYDKDAARTLLGARPEHILLRIPGTQGNTFLELQEAAIGTEELVVRISSTGAPIPLPAAIHYRGIIQGDPGSMAAISVFEGELMGIISDGSGERIVGRFDKGPAGLHVLYHEDHLRGTSNATCGTTSEGVAYRQEDLELQEGMRTLRCVRLYWEAAHDIVLNKGGVANATNYLTGLFNQSATLFDNDGIDVQLSELFVWDTPSPYNGTSSNSRLTQFGNYRTSFNGDLAHLIDLGNYGGIAWLNSLCSSTNYRMAYSGINATYQNVPTYSWSVEVVTHEQGHNMGSSHTHACVWNGNNTAIDGCGQSAGYTEGNCPTGPIPSSSVGGTIMSYCHLTSSTIKFANGFGPQPTAVITNNINAAGCLSMCGSSCDAPGASVTLGAGSATISWGNMGATSYDLQWKVATSSTWTTVTGITGTSHQLNGLNEGTTYNYRVRSNCGGTTSSWSATGSFTTPVPCTDAYEPNNGLASATSISLPATVNALIGSTTDADHFRFTTDQTSNISLSLTDLAGDYDVRLLNASGTQIAISQNGNTQSEYISYNNAAAGTYYVHVYGWNGEHSTIICYTLSVSNSGAQGCGTPAAVAAGSMTTNGATITWNATQGATTYDLQWKMNTAATWQNVNNISGTSHTLSGLDPATAYDVRVRADCSAGSSLYSAPSTFTTLEDPCSTGARVAVRLWLDGAYDEAQQMMRDDLRTQGLIPLTEPYTAAGMPVEGSTSTTNAVLSISGNAAMVDWVLIELRDPADPAEVLGVRAGLVRRDGHVVDPTDGVSPISFCLPTGSYHVAVRHRNHLGCMTFSAASINSSGTVVDLRSASTSTFGNTARKNLNGAMRLWSGNTNGDQMVKYTGSMNDRDPILSSLGGIIPTNTMQGYHQADLDLDGQVKYTGANNDRDKILSTVGGVIPTNVVIEQLP